jgi:hypothetical protein
MSVVHYAHRRRVRWRRGRWLVMHEPRSAVCVGGANDYLFTYERALVNCKRCLKILPLIDAFTRGHRKLN